MESLGGDQLWFDRFVAEHAAIVYYWVLIGMYLLSPKDAYVFSELVEWHATDTYEVFVQANADALAELPPPLVAANYYRNQDLYMVRRAMMCCIALCCAAGWLAGWLAAHGRGACLRGARLSIEMSQARPRSGGTGDTRRAQARAQALTLLPPPAAVRRLPPPPV